jgi:hypothetical protein
VAAIGFDPTKAKPTVYRLLPSSWEMYCPVSDPRMASPICRNLNACADPDPAVRDQAIREVSDIVQAAYREVAGG